MQQINGYSIIKFLKIRRFELLDSLSSYFKYFISLLWSQDPKDRPYFSDIVQIFDSGIILK